MTSNIYKVILGVNSKLIFSAGFIGFLMMGALTASAQEPTHEQTIKITSSYKPKLLNPAKINLTASPLKIDTTRSVQKYNVPAQHLFFNYQPIAGNPDSLHLGGALDLGKRNYVKAGYGTSYSPYLKGVIEAGDGKEHLFNISAEYTSGKGKIPFQKFSDLDIRSTESYFVKDHELYVASGFRSQGHFQYGYDHDLLEMEKGDIQTKLNTNDIDLGARNLVQNSFGINYDPHLRFAITRSKHRMNEKTFGFTVPVWKTINENMDAGLRLQANFNSYARKIENFRTQNNLFEITPSFRWHDEQFDLHAGITPAFDNGDASLMPDFYGEVKIPESPLVVLAGWRGRYDPNSFRTLYDHNPFIQDSLTLTNSKKAEVYGGLRFSFAKHFVLNTKLSYGTWKDVPLFINNELAPWQFLVVNESKMNVFLFHTDLNFIQSDLFSVTAGLDATSFSGLRDQPEAWGLYPLKINASARWHLLEELMLKADIDAFSGSKALSQTGDVKSVNGGADLSLGAEYIINKMFSAWLDINNLFNNKYEYWNRYPVFGLQVIGGVKVRF